MVSLQFLFYIFLALFGIIGMIRGLRKEIVVTVAGILSLFIIDTVVPKLWASLDATNALYVNLAVIFVTAFFGYQTPGFQRISSRFERDSLVHLVMGGVTGALNGYIFFSSAWYYLAQAGYPFSWILAPDANTKMGQAAIALLENAFPAFLTGSWLYILLAAAVMLMIVVIL